MSTQTYSRDTIVPVVRIGILNAEFFNMPPTVTIPSPGLHPRRIHAALLAAGLDSVVAWRDLIGLTYWLAGIENRLDYTWGMPHDNVQRNYGLTINYLPLNLGA